MIPTINGRQFEFADIRIIVGGHLLNGCRGIEYKISQEKELLYGKGNKPMSIQHGNYAYEGTLTVTQDELETLTLAGKGDLMSLKLDAVVVYGNPANGDALITDRIYGIEFTENSKSLQQGDKFMDVSIPFICVDIQCQQA